ncbi:hypothetical protein FV230_13830 [Methylobacterium sp. WL6]|nr:hypothetical protein FV230_13830 [Methylobacterium sp. WL6]
MDDKSTVAAIQDDLSAKVAEVQRLGSALAARVRYACPSSDDLGYSAVFRSGGSGPSGVRG